MHAMHHTPRRPWRALALAASLLASAATAQAQLFGDDEARRGVLDLRQRFEQAVTAQNQLVAENAQMRRSLLDLQQQIDAMREELARARGQNEQLSREAQELRPLREQMQSLEERLSRLEGGSANALSGAGEGAAAQEKPEYDAALNTFRNGDFKAAQTAFSGFIRRHPNSSLAPAALFWLGNAQYATGDYRQAIGNFRSLLTAAPQHQRAPEAMLSIANCQIELKDTRAARATLESLIKTYPQSEAAVAGKERLAQLR